MVEENKVDEEKRGRKRKVNCEHELRSVFYRMKGSKSIYKKIELNQFYCPKCNKMLKMGITEI
jgi:ribosomal protein L33